jgi:hypothetical protein
MTLFPSAPPAISITKIRTRNQKKCLFSEKTPPPAGFCGCVGGEENSEQRTVNSEQREEIFGYRYRCGGCVSLWEEKGD